MKIQEIAQELNLNAICLDDGSAADVTGGYSSDLMSDVLGKAKKGNVWVTNQKHLNVVAVASLLGLSGVIMVGGVKPDENAIEKAVEEKIPLFTTDMPAFEVIGRLYSLGVRGDGR
jgi:hypothetical protein